MIVQQPLLGVSGTVKNLSFEIKADANLQQLVSFVMTYSQELPQQSLVYSILWKREY